MPRARFLQKALRGAKAPEPVAETIKPVGKVPEKRVYDAKKADPANYSVYSNRLYRQFEEAKATGEHHFRVGGQEIYFPWEKVALLKPSAKMTPFQAQFQVPRQFNKLDFRDYLWHLYGLRALNITTQIKWSQWTRSRMSRYRTPQVKKMIIDMEEPFVWPAEDSAALESHRLSASLAFQKFEMEMQERHGSDLRKPAKAFDGIMGPYPLGPQSYTPKRVESQLKNVQKKAEKSEKRQKENELIRGFLKL